MGNILEEVQIEVQDRLNADSQLSGLCAFIAENRKDVDYEIKAALGKQGVVGLVLTPRATFAGAYEDKSLVWQLDELEIDIVENVTVNRGKRDGYVTGQDAAMRLFDVLCPLSGDNEGQFSPVSYEEGEDGSLLVNKCVLKCLVHTDREEPGPVIPTSSGVKFTDGTFLDIQNSNANVWHQSQSGATYFFPLAGRPIVSSFVGNVEEVTILDSGTGNSLQAIMTPTTCKRVYIGPNWYFTINNMFQFATSLEEVFFIGRTMEEVQ